MLRSSRSAWETPELVLLLIPVGRDLCRGDARIGLTPVPVLPHLAPEKASASILRSGIKALSPGLGAPKGVFCLPVLPDYAVTHQWLRELKRRGQRTIVAADFRLASGEMVWVGHYNRPHEEMS